MAFAERRIVLSPKVLESDNLETPVKHVICATLEIIFALFDTIRSEFQLIEDLIVLLRCLVYPAAQVKDLNNGSRCMALGDAMPDCHVTAIQRLLQLSSQNVFYATRPPAPHIEHELHVADVGKLLRTASSADLVRHLAIATKTTPGQRSGRWATKQLGQVHLSSAERKAVALLVTLRSLATLLPDHDTDVVDPILTEPRPSPTDDHLINSMRRSRRRIQFSDEHVNPLVVKPTPTVSFEECPRSPETIELQGHPAKDLTNTLENMVGGCFV
ncbi:MAG: hypothetical protein KVP17_001959 [Porospora cf. gigantea B]|uniref:uncharacterized protein n=1 Tax=Porospora cf. gigantea B TaxID=2853592 RepID=UPI003571C7F0|nr:MAG: hypothetical protein KVP17_001959 [Porospora cf. gigantea B]